MRARHERAQAAHPADVLLAAEVMDDDAGAHEQQRLEERVRHQVEDRVAVRADPGRDEHVADLRHRRVRDDALDVPLHERDHSRDEERDRAEDRGEVLDVRRRLEDRARADEQVDAGGDHRRRVDQRGDRRRAFHRVREPRVERDLRRLRDRAAEEAERDEVHGRRRQRVDVLEHAQVLERPRLPDEQDEPERERRVADRVHHERLLRGGHGFRACGARSRSGGTTRGRRAPSRRAGGGSSPPARAAASRRRRATCRRSSDAPRRRLPGSPSSTRR